MDDSLRMTRAGGCVVVAGAPGMLKNLDWTAAFYKELTVKGANIFNHSEWYQGRKQKSYDIAINLMVTGKVDLAWMVTHRFTLDAFRPALRLLGKRGHHGAIKALFEFPNPREVCDVLEKRIPSVCSRRNCFLEPGLSRMFRFDSDPERESDGGCNGGCNGGRDGGCDGGCDGIGASPNR